MNIINLLKQYQDLNYQKFQSKICPTNYEIIGVKIPLIRKITKDLLKNYRYEEIISFLDYHYFECILIKLFSIAYIDIPFLDKVSLIEKTLPLIDNWALCDTFVSSLKFIKEYREDYLLYIKKYLKSNQEFTLRFAIVVLLNYYLDDAYYEEVLNILVNINSNYYYVNMAISWAYSLLFIKYYEATLNFFTKNKDSIKPWIYNKSIQKACESYRLTQYQKEQLKSLKN